MKIFLTGATGFIGGHVARLLRERGDEVVCLVRDPARATGLSALGCELLRGDLSSKKAIRAGVEGADAVIHGAAIYEVGIPGSEHAQMYEANVRGTENVLGAALAAGTPKVVYISTVAAFGDTHGEVVDEAYQHPGDSFTSYYEETKTEAHKVAKRLVADGLPCVIVQPGGVYGPGDHSSMGAVVGQFIDGKMPLIAFPDMGLSMVHVEDVAAGVLLGLDKGTPGESYILSGETIRMRGIIETVGNLVGRKAPKHAMPTPLLKVLAPVGPVVGKLMKQPPNLRELISSADGVTFWATHKKATAELGYSPRPFKEGMRETLITEGKLPAGA